MKKTFIAFMLFILIPHAGLFSQDFGKVERIITRRLDKWTNPLVEWDYLGKVTLDSVKQGKDENNIGLYFSTILSTIPLREATCNRFTESIKEKVGRRFRKYTLEFYTGGYPLVQLIPNIYRTNIAIDSTRIPVVAKYKPLVVRRIDSEIPEHGLYGKSIALWHSHGYYFEMKLDRWEWQRATLFGTVEDVYVMSYVLPYLTKMLENAGANVFLPRERDTQIHEVIVDNDRSTGRSQILIDSASLTEEKYRGFILADTIFGRYNPFQEGTSIRIKTDTAVYLPEIPEDGMYAVYVSYPLRHDNSTAVKYTVNHTGGKTEFLVNQNIGGGTWIYLGTFKFLSGMNIGYGSVKVSSEPTDKGYIGLDAIRFGGGMGNVARKPSPEVIANQRSVNDSASSVTPEETSDYSHFHWKVSGKPRYVEGSRYWLQYAGMPDTLVYSPNSFRNDYNDDYQSRGLWVNYLISSPNDELYSRQVPGGLGIPVDLSFAFHTDAGVTPNDSVIGTLAICSTTGTRGKFPDGSSRLESRDLADIVQTQIVNDIRSQYDPEWTRRAIWDRPYSEARRPDVPAMLLELLSHQNLADLRYGLDPRFRFSVCRAVYKGILRFLSYPENRDYIVQPLPVTHFAITPVTGKLIRLSWEPCTDPLEPTAKPDRYRVYKRTGDNGFDNGVIVSGTSTELELEAYNTVYSFKVTALNEGGESFESEILSVGIKDESRDMVLVINGFDRISGPEWFDKDDMAGIAWWSDRGEADHNEISTIGNQYDFNRLSPWLDDDAPGWGASYTDMAGIIFPGNTFDYTYIHGKAILAAGKSFISVSDEYFCSDKFRMPDLKILDLIFGEEKSVASPGNNKTIDFKIYTPEFMNRIKELSEAGVNIFMSGAYVGTDLYQAGDSTAIDFAIKYLHFTHRTDHAVNKGEVYATDYAFRNFTGSFEFNSAYSPSVYSVESPDAIEPAGEHAICAFRYSQKNLSAGVIFEGNNRTMVLGFPFETILKEENRNFLMMQILKFFEK
jgi:N-acetylmuramoyl-L-alanine amidase